MHDAAAGLSHFAAAEVLGLILQLTAANSAWRIYRSYNGVGNSMLCSVFAIVSAWEISHPLTAAKAVGSRAWHGTSTAEPPS